MNPYDPNSHEQPGTGLGQTLRNILLVGALLGTFGMNISCSGGGGGSSSTPATTPAAPTSVIGTVVNYITNQPVSGATVTDGTTTTSTASDGSYALQVTPSGRKQITVKAVNFGDTQQITPVVGGKANQVDVALLPATVTQIQNLASDTAIVVPNTPAQVLLPANGLVTPGGGVPVFPVTASLTPIDPSGNPQLMPGDYTTSAGEQLESFGALDATFTDSTGTPLNLAPGKTATIQIPLASFHWGGTPPATVPAFYFDATSGRWVQEGTLTLAGSGIDQYYVGTVGHFTTWNADNVAATTCITGKVVRTDGSFVPGAVVTATGTSYLGTSSTTSSATDGTFQLSVMANQTFTVGATLGYLTTGTPILTVTNPSCTLNGTFTSTSFWMLGSAKWVISGGLATHSSGDVATLSESQIGLVAGTNYTVTYTVSGYAGPGSIRASLGGTNGTARSANGTYTETINCGSSNTNLVFTPSANTYVGSVSNVSVIPVASGGCQAVGNLVIDGQLLVTGTIRDFSPSAPYQLTGYTTTTVSPGTNLMRLNNGDPATVIDEGQFPSTNNWSLGSGWAISGGNATCSSGTGGALTLTLQRSGKNLLVSGNTCTLTYTLTRTAGTLTPNIGGTGGNGTARTASGTYTDTITCGSTNSNVVFTASSSFRGSISNVTLTDGHPAPIVINANTLFPMYTGDAALGSLDGPWWNPDFEMSNSWMGQFPGIVNVQLGANNKPVFSGQSWNQGGVHSTASFNAWWTDFPYPHGSNDPTPYQGLYTIPLAEVLPSTTPPTYAYDNQVQFPNDGKFQGNYIYDNTGSTSGTRGTQATAPEDGKWHNFSYTYELHLLFTYKTGQVFTFIGDDDVYVFINKLLVIDLGGVHSALTGSVTLNSSTKATDGVTPLNLVDGQVYQFDFFYCERHTTQSHMKITTSIPLNDTLIPN